MQSIGAVPMGLLALLRSQNFGEMPRVLGDVVSPVLDLGDYYELNQIEHGFGQFTPALGFPTQAGLVGSAISLTVPVGEMWIVHQASQQCGPAPATGYRSQIVLIETPIQPIALTDMVLTNNPQFQFTKTADRFVATAGTRIGLNFDTVTGVPGDSNLFIRFTRLRV